MFEMQANKAKGTRTSAWSASNPRAVGEGRKEPTPLSWKRELQPGNQCCHERQQSFHALRLHQRLSRRVSQEGIRFPQFGRRRSIIRGFDGRYPLFPPSPRACSRNWNGKSTLWLRNEFATSDTKVAPSTKHIAVRFYRLREEVLTGTVQFVQIPTQPLK